MYNDWGKKYLIQGLDFEAVPFKKSINMFERMDIVEYIYEGVTEPNTKELNRSGQMPTMLEAEEKPEEEMNNQKQTLR